MELSWWPVISIGLVGLAAGIGAVVWWPRRTAQRRPLANTARLTRLPEYVRAARRRAVTVILGAILLLIGYLGAVVAAARPADLPTAQTRAAAVAPEDVMVCVAGPVSDRAVGAGLRYFADAVRDYGTERIGLTSANRRVVPLTRDYQYAAAQFADYATAPSAGPPFVAPVRYADYTEDVTDILAMCLTGLPPVGATAPVRRSIIYLGPESLRRPGDDRPGLLSPERLTDLAVSTGVQINTVVTGAADGRLAAISERTGGRTYPAQSDVIAHLTDIRNHPPATAAETTAVTSRETPDIPLLVAIAAMLLLAVWPVVVRS